MAANPEATVVAGQEDRGTKIRRLATFLIVVGPEIAAEIVKQFEENDIVDISTEMAKIETVDLTTQRKLLEEFSQIALEAAVSISGGPQYTHSVLEKSIGSYRAHELIHRLVPKRQHTEINTDALRELESQHLFNILKSEDTQTIAFVLSYVDPSKCSETLACFRADVREEVVERIAMMEPTSTDVVSEVLETLKKQAGTGRDPSTRSGGIQSIADVINRMEGSMSKSLMSGLDERNPELSKSIKKILFTFEDLKRLDSITLQKVLREVESNTLAIALKTASEALQASIFGALPKRAASSIKDEIKFMPPVRLREIEAAQEQVIESMRKLEALGEITIGSGGKSEVLV
jgi:flagellar motor switch protein FliG